MIQFNNLTDAEEKAVADGLRSQAAVAVGRGDHAAAIRLYSEAEKIGAEKQEEAAPEKGVTLVRAVNGQEVPVSQVSPFMRNVMGVTGGDAA